MQVVSRLFLLLLQYITAVLQRLWLPCFCFNRELARLPQRGWRQIPEAALVGGHGCTGETNHKHPFFFLFICAYLFYFKPLVFKKRTTASGKHVFLSQIWHFCSFIVSLLCAPRLSRAELKIIRRSGRHEVLSNVLFADRWRHGFHREDELHPQGPACRQHPRRRQPGVQDRRLWPGQVDRRQRVHGEARWAHTHSLYLAESQVNEVKWMEQWPHSKDDSLLSAITVNLGKRGNQMLLFRLISCAFHPLGEFHSPKLQPYNHLAVHFSCVYHKFEISASTLTQRRYTS